MTEHSCPEKARDMRITGFSRACLKMLIEDLLDDPSWLLHPDQDYVPAEELAFYRVLAADLGLDFDKLVAQGTPIERERLAKLERGETL